MSQASEPETPPPEPRASTNTSQRRSNRLADTAKSTEGKGAIQVAEDLLVKKLGDLSPKIGQLSTEQFEFFAQHFDRPRRTP